MSHVIQLIWISYGQNFGLWSQFLVRILFRRTYSCISVGLSRNNLTGPYLLLTMVYSIVSSMIVRSFIVPSLDNCGIGKSPSLHINTLLNPILTTWFRNSKFIYNLRKNILIVLQYILFWFLLDRKMSAE